MRVEHWESRLAEQITLAQNKPFQWGEHDCCLWAADTVLAITEVDHMAAFRGKYKSERGAMRLMKKKYNSLNEAVSALLPSVSVKMAQRGDVVSHNGALGICSGINSFFVSPSGLLAVKTLKCDAAWRVD